MAPLIRNMSRHDAQWSKFKSSYMWNNVYYLRRSKFAVYQLATTMVNVVNGVGISTLKQYNKIQGKNIPDFPNASVDTSDFVGSFAFNVFACVFLAIFFGAAVFFDLFWPEREEAPVIQWTWKLCAAASSTFMLAASLAITVIVAAHGVQINGVTAEQERIIRANWDGPSLEYRHDGRALATVVTCWVTAVFTIWSTIIMWRAYAHNNKYGPFADHKRRMTNGESISMENDLPQS
ncbi:hypothetical protein F5884DRAFT_753338 [Xylogone sp. PMI_703]|nr:hypothetical protein F5884DRAFT_753338 [Xylogone sp. PMI_703]